MKLLILFVAWCILAVLCWPVALLTAALLPVIWVLSIPFRFLAIVVHAILALIKTLLFLPARILGYRSATN